MTRRWRRAARCDAVTQSAVHQPQDGSGVFGRTAASGRDRPSRLLPGPHPDMDEPTAALGPAETAQVHAARRPGRKSEGIGIFLISHDIHDVFDLADRISVMLDRPARWHRQQRRRHQGRSVGDDHHGQAAGRGVGPRLRELHSKLLPPNRRPDTASLVLQSAVEGCRRALRRPMRSV